MKFLAINWSDFSEGALSGLAIGLLLGVALFVYRKRTNRS
jgi:LPXTG-motif cell wall-anchored protein